MNGIKTKVDPSSIVISPPPRVLKTKGRKELTHRPIQSLDDLFSQEASILRVLQFQTACLKMARYMADAAISYAKDMSEEELKMDWRLSGVNQACDRHEVLSTSFNQ
jgi:hypothetical protein